MKRRLLALALCLSLALLSGCRTRLTGTEQEENGETQNREASRETGGEATETEEAGTEPDGGAERENPQAGRKVYDDMAQAESSVHEGRRIISGGGAEASPGGAGEGTPEDRLREEAARTVLAREVSEEATEMETGEEAQAADSLQTYYTVLLRERADSLFECKRLNVYWETEEDRVTVYRTSPEHGVILMAGAYDTASRLLEENLHVDDGWIARKNPDLIVKTVGKGLLGAGASSGGPARRMLERDGLGETGAVRHGRVLLLSGELLSSAPLRTAAALVLAACAYPELYADVNVGEAVSLLYAEAEGHAPEGDLFLMP